MVEVTLVENCDIMELHYKMEQIYVSTKVIHCESVKLVSLMEKGGGENSIFIIVWFRM